MLETIIFQFLEVTFFHGNCKKLSTPNTIDIHILPDVEWFPDARNIWLNKEDYQNFSQVNSYAANQLTYIKQKELEIIVARSY